jgi:hypothetical protein
MRIDIVDPPARHRSAYRLVVVGFILVTVVGGWGCGSSASPTAAEPQNVVVAPAKKAPNGQVRSRTPRN